MVSRREALKLGAAGFAATALLVGCGKNSEPAEPTATPEPTEVPSAVGTPLSSIVISETPTHQGDNAVRTFQGDPARTGAMPGPGPSWDLPIIIRWKQDLAGEGTTPPVVVEDTVFITSGSSVLALNVSTGIEKWRFETSQTIYCTPTVASGILFVGSNDEHIYAIDAMTGQGIWKAHVGDAIHGSPAVVDGTVYITTIGNGSITEGPTTRFAEGTLFALDASNGTERWRFTMIGTSYCAPAVSNFVVHTTCTEGYVYTISADNGRELWRKQVGTGARRSAVVSKGLVYVSLGDTNLYALDQLSGNEKWRFWMGSSLQSEPTVHEGSIYFGNSDGVTFAVNANSGIEKWRTEWNDPFWTNYSPSITDGMVYQGLRALNGSSGNHVADYEYASITEIHSNSRCSQTVIDGMVFVVTSEFLFAITNLIPTVISQATILRGAPSPTGVSYGTVYIGNEVTRIISEEIQDGQVWAQVVINEVTGWIPLDAIDPSTLPPEGEVEYLWIPTQSSDRNPIPKPTPTPIPSPSPTPIPVPDQLWVGDIVITLRSSDLMKKASVASEVIRTLDEGESLEVLYDLGIMDSVHWYLVEVQTDSARGYIDGAKLAYPS